MRAVLLLFGLALGSLGASSCDSTRGRQVYYEGDAVPVIAQAESLPATREGYGRLAAYTAEGTNLVLMDPGTGPDAPPRFVRAFDLSRMIVNVSQVDRDGFVWLGMPDGGTTGVPHNELFVLDPHTATIHRRILLPETLRGIAHVIISEDAVYLRAWLDGFQAAIGMVPRACVHDATRCDARLLTDLGRAGLSGEYAFHLRGDTLYSFSGGSGSTTASRLDLIARTTGANLRSTTGVSSSFSVRPDALHFVRSSGASGGFDVTRMDPTTLDVLARAPAILIGNSGEEYLARQGASLYTSSHRSTVLFVRDAHTLAVTDTLRLPPFEYGMTPVFGFVAPDMLLLNGGTAYDTRNGRLLTRLAPDRFTATFTQGLMLPQGHPLQR